MMMMAAAAMGMGSVLADRWPLPAEVDISAHLIAVQEAMLRPHVQQQQQQANWQLQIQQQMQMQQQMQQRQQWLPPPLPPPLPPQLLTEPVSESGARGSSAAADEPCLIPGDSVSGARTSPRRALLTPSVLASAAAATAAASAAAAAAAAAAPAADTIDPVPLAPPPAGEELPRLAHMQLLRPPLGMVE